MQLQKSSDNKNFKELEEVIKLVKKNCTTKFNESIDVSFRLNLKQKKEEINIRTVVNLPNGNGKKIKIAVLCEDTKIQEAKVRIDNHSKTVKSEPIKIKLQEVKKYLKEKNKQHKIKNEDLVDLLHYYELIGELNKVN